MNKNITLSSFSSIDRGWLSELLIDKDVRKFLPHLTTDVDKFICDMEVAERKGLGMLWIIRLKDIGIGFIVVYDLTEEPFLFYAMLPTFSNKGYMHYAIRLIEKDYSSLLSTIVDANNVRSLKILTNTTIKAIEVITL